MENIDVRKPIDVERHTYHEFELHKQKIRDTVAALSMQSQKEIDRMTVSSHASSYIKQGVHLREVSRFCSHFQRYVPQEALEPMMKSGRECYDAVRQDWLMALTKVRDGVAPAENFYSSVAPGMSEKEHNAYKKILRDAKAKQKSAGDSFSRKKKYNRGRGGGGGRGGYGGGDRRGSDYDFDPFRDNSGEALKSLMEQNEGLRRKVFELKSQNEYLSLIIGNLKVQSYLISKKYEMLRDDTVLLLLQIKQAHHGAIPYKPVNYSWFPSAGRDQYRDGGRGGGGYHSGGGGYRGGYKGSNHRGGHGGGGGGGGFGGNQSGGGATN